ncbi:MAG: hypothetical protein GF334_08110 [Candidatus Altiarchaeales archaeon]|nr:hypothetical protein [Candidatus Altiarchaeales archaeon]
MFPRGHGDPSPSPGEKYAEPKDIFRIFASHGLTRELKFLIKYWVKNFRKNDPRRAEYLNIMAEGYSPTESQRKLLEKYRNSRTPRSERLTKEQLKYDQYQFADFLKKILNKKTPRDLQKLTTRLISSLEAGKNLGYRQPTQIQRPSPQMVQESPSGPASAQSRIKATTKVMKALGLPNPSQIKRLPLGTLTKLLIRRGLGKVLPFTLRSYPRNTQDELNTIGKMRPVLKDIRTELPKLLNPTDHRSQINRHYFRRYEKHLMNRLQVPDSYESKVLLNEAYKKQP